MNFSLCCVHIVPTMMMEWVVSVPFDSVRLFIVLVLGVIFG